MIRVVVSGGRDYDNWQLVQSTLRQFHDRYGIKKLIHGDARGADFFAKTWAFNNFVDQEPHRANWDELGKKAGRIRNEKMIATDPDLAIVFEGGVGTRHLTSVAALSGVPILKIPDSAWLDRFDKENGLALIGEPYRVEKPFWINPPTVEQKRKFVPLPALLPPPTQEQLDRYRDTAYY